MMFLVIGITSALKLKCDSVERVTKITLTTLTKITVTTSEGKDALSFVVNCQSCGGIRKTTRLHALTEELVKLGLDLSSQSKKEIDCGGKYLKKDITLEDMWKTNFTSHICTDEDCRVAIQYFDH